MTHPLTPPEKVAAFLKERDEAVGVVDADDAERLESADAILTALASGSGGHAELAHDIRKLCVGHPHAKIAWPHYELHALADRAEALLAENAALRETADVTRADKKMLLDLSVQNATRATEAERKLAEAVGLLRDFLPWSRKFPDLKGRITAFISKEAERG